MFEVEIRGWFAAAHQLRMPDGQLEPLHGHNWQVRITFRGDTIDATGMLVDFTVAKPALDAVLRPLHDTNLNDHPEFSVINPSAENVIALIAKQMQDKIGDSARIHVAEIEEAPNCWARFYPHGP
ncbi:MAG: 6-pyruvoyl tetrahydropterin synthase family protein [Phycisphaerae bacterium]